MISVALVHNGPNSQFKDKYVMRVLEMLLERHVRTLWNFSATSHSKGPVDSIQATLKWTAADKVKRIETVINSTI